MQKFPEIKDESDFLFYEQYLQNENPTENEQNCGLKDEIGKNIVISIILGNRIYRYYGVLKNVFGDSLEIEDKKTKNTLYFDKRRVFSVIVKSK